jgi:hypothetical protein
MSIWTHVVGCVRVDGLPGIVPKCTKEAIRETIGPMSLFDDWNDKSKLPSGSEGSLHYEIIEYDFGLPWIAIPFWGDLRDFDNPDEIKKWWSELLPKLGMIRDAVLRVEVEGGNSYIFEAEKRS